MNFNQILRNKSYTCFGSSTGDGILKAAIRMELDEVLALRCSFSAGDQQSP